MPTERKWGDKHDVAKHLGVSPRTVERMGERGEIRAYTVGQRLIRYDLAEIDEMIAANSTTPCHTALAPQEQCADCGTYNPALEEEQRSAAHQDA